MTERPTNTPEMTVALVREGLDAALAQIAARVEAVGAKREMPPFALPEASALPALMQVFGLSAAEAELLCLAVGCELDAGFAASVKAVNGTGLVDLAFADRMFGAGVWDMLCPEAPLRHWRLVELAGSGPLHQRHIRPDERIVQALLGVTYRDTRLEGMLNPVRLPSARAEDAYGGDAAATLARAWSGGGPLPVILLGGGDPAGKRHAAARAARAVGLGLYRMDAGDIPGDWIQRAALAVLIERELALSGAALLIEVGGDTGAAAAGLAEAVGAPCILAAEDPPLTERTPRLRIDLDRPDAMHRRDLWAGVLGAQAEALGPALDRLAGQFALDAAGIETAAASAGPGMSPDAMARHLWDAARVQARRALDGLAGRIEARAAWEDLVLPADQTALLKDVAGHLRSTWQVNHDWGWEMRSPRGLGAAALFAGPSGTGKTLAAEVLAADLGLDLYRIDLSQVVSKYIGETEKNLSRIFRAAEDGGAILLFDEADALFGKRSEVKDSHDRYANVEVSYLLQRMEAYRGLAILTTNQKSALDTAFLRRLRYVVTFPFPDAAARAAIWARIFPPETPVNRLDPGRLANLSISGGTIRSIALNATYLAADAGSPVGMAHIHRAARREYAKLEKPFKAAEQGAFR